jgi:hypothetical protein
VVASFVGLVVIVGSLFQPEDGIEEMYPTVYLGGLAIAGVAGLALSFAYALHVEMRVLRNILIVAAIIVSGALLYEVLVDLLEAGGADAVTVGVEPGSDQSGDP